MRQLSAFLYSIIAFISVFVVSNEYTERYVRQHYRDDIAKQWHVELNQGLTLQKLSAEKDDALLIYGSSELRTYNLQQHPVNFFPRKECKMSAKIFGRGYSQSFIHLMNFMAMPQNLKGKKIVFIISLQWFLEKEGLRRVGFKMNFPPLHFYALMRNKDVPEDLKEYVARRVYFFTMGDKNYESENFFCRFYLINKPYNKIVLGFFKPCFDAIYYILTLKDNFKSAMLIKNFFMEKALKEDYKNLKETDWKEELEIAYAEGKKLANNLLHVENSQYKWYSEHFLKYKNRAIHVNLLDSQEYSDLKALMQLCKAEDIRPLFILMPVLGKWYDNLGLNVEQRKAFYNEVEKLIESYGFKSAKFSDKEYEPYLMLDSEHFGWKGWLYINEQIVKYCSEN